jgi:hypothetical protein
MSEVAIPPALPEPVLAAGMSSLTVATDESVAVCGHCGGQQLGPYCHACGQRHLEERITLRLVWREFAQRFLRLERGLPRTFWELLLRPGAVARDYVGGRRRPYVSPLSYLLIATAVSVLLVPLYSGAMSEAFDPDNGSARQQMELGARLSGGTLQDLTPEQEDRVRASMVRLGEELPRAVSDLYSVLYLAFALFLAGALRFFMAGRTRRFNFAETLVFTLFVSAQLAFLGSVLALLAYPLGQTFAALSSIGLTGIIVLQGVRGFYDRSATTFALGFLSLALAFVAYMVLIAVTAYPLAMYRVIQAG